MTFIRYLFLGLLAFVLIVLAVANLQSVSVGLLPGPLADFADYIFGGAATREPGDRPYSIDGVPLFVVILASAAVGLAIGFTWEWVREHKHRAEARAERARKEELERELAKTRRVAGEQDEVLALLETSR